jgi:solute carrier family 15 (peptide/histidine transporter), member 3/4
MPAPTGKKYPSRFGISIAAHIINRTPFNADEEPLLQDEGEFDPDRSVLRDVAGYILATEFCERLAYFGFAGSLVLFFQTHMDMSNAEADVQYAAWSGACYVTPLLGGLIADTYLGRYKTVLYFSLLYAAGLYFVLLASTPGDAKEYLVFPAMYIIALGTGGIKPNVCTLGADQFDEKYSQDRKEKESFFNWFYWSVNMASVIALTAIAYICQFGVPGLGGERWGFFVGYSIPCVFMTVAIVVFVAGTARYVMHPPQASTFASAVGVVYEACWTKRGRIPPQLAMVSEYHVLDKACINCGGSYSKTQVECVKLVARLLPFLLSLVPFWGVYAQVYTAFQNQGCQMNLSIGGVAKVPISTLGVFESLAILIGVPIFDQWLFPKLKEAGYSVSMLQRMGAGFVVSIIGMLVATGVEEYRLSTAPIAGDYYDVAARDNITPCQSIDDYNPYQYQSWEAGIDDASQPQYCTQICDQKHESPDVPGLYLLDLPCIDCDDIPQVSSLSVFWQAPQFFLIGLSLCLAGITALEFFYTQAPLAMRSVTQALNLLTNALGTWATIPLVLLVNVDPRDEWLPTNFDDGHLSWYFLLLAGLMGLDLLYFYYISKDYEYKSEAELASLDYAPLHSFDSDDDGKG